VSTIKADYNPEFVKVLLTDGEIRYLNFDCIENIRYKADKCIIAVVSGVELYIAKEDGIKLFGDKTKEV